MSTAARDTHRSLMSIESKIALTVALSMDLAILFVLTLPYSALIPLSLLYTLVFAGEWLLSLSLPAVIGMPVYGFGTVLGLSCLWFGRFRWAKQIGVGIALLSFLFLRATW